MEADIKDPVFAGENLDIHVPNIRRLTEIHIERFRSRLDAHAKGTRHDVRPDECQRYLELWKGIRDKFFTWEDLSDLEKNEITEAIEDGE